jgi:hypothetical protein
MCRDDAVACILHTATSSFGPVVLFVAATFSGTYYRAILQGSYPILSFWIEPTRHIAQGQYSAPTDILQVAEYAYTPRNIKAGDTVSGSFSGIFSEDIKVWRCWCGWRLVRPYNNCNYHTNKSYNPALLPAIAAIKSFVAGGGSCFYY